MLVLSQRCYEPILVGDDIEITVVHIGGDTVRLGIKAPPKVSVHRKEASRDAGVSWHSRSIGRA